MMKRMSIILLLLVMVTVSAGCGKDNQDQEDQEHDSHTTHLPNGDIQEQTSSVNVLPDFLNQQPKEIQQVYQIAAMNYELLQSIPCYCGCGDSAGHQSNMSCFLKEANESAVIWDDHGTRCNLCMQIAVESSKMNQDGKSTIEIRNYIDEKYSEIGAKPTPTPMPEV